MNFSSHESHLTLLKKGVASNYDINFSRRFYMAKEKDKKNEKVKVKLTIKEKQERKKEKGKKNYD